MLLFHLTYFWLLFLDIYFYWSSICQHIVLTPSAHPIKCPPQCLSPIFLITSETDHPFIHLLCIMLPFCEPPFHNLYPVFYTAESICLADLYNFSTLNCFLELINLVHWTQLSLVVRKKNWAIHSDVLGPKLGHRSLSSQAPPNTWCGSGRPGSCFKGLCHSFFTCLPRPPN